jgi:AAA domain
MTERFQPKSLDLAALIEQGPPAYEFVESPYLPTGASIWAAGATESGKSMWALATSCELTRRGLYVVYVSQENPLVVEWSRLVRFRPDPRFLIFFHYAGFDLALADHVDALAEAAVDLGDMLAGPTRKASLIVIDTHSACWSGDENANEAIAAYDRDSVRPLIEHTGASVLTLDHTGHPQAFVARKGASAVRGASAKGQKADVVLGFKATGPHQFEIEHAKNRFGAKEPIRALSVEDDEDDDTLALVPVETSHDRNVLEVADTVVELVRAADGATSTRAIRDALKGKAGRELLNEAFTVLEYEDPPRLGTGKRQIEGRDGKIRLAKAWWDPNQEPHL